MTQVNKWHLVVAAAIGAAIALSASSAVRSAYQAQSIDEFERLLDQVPVLLDPNAAQATRGVMKRSMVAHANRDANAAIAELGEGYAWIAVSEDGYQEMVSGRETAAEATRNLYQGDGLKNYLGATSTPIAIAGNFGIQVDYDNFQKADGSIEVKKTLSVFEVRGGKLLHLWSFWPGATELSKSK